jgi:K+-transporting ATPase ATPase A chain
LFATRSATIGPRFPVSIVVGLFFVWQGVPQNLGAYTEATTLEGAKQVIAQGPVASQEVIKMFGTNGGGFFNTNSAHPFENPNAITNFVQIVLIFAIGAANWVQYARTVRGLTLVEREKEYVQAARVIGRREKP